MSYYLENGSVLLEDLIASCEGKANPIRNYSAEEILRATNNFDNDLIIDTFSSAKMFKGSIDNRLVTVKIFDYFGNRRSQAWSQAMVAMAIRDIIISMQMSTHKNVLKLLGCCLEFEIPALVYEYAGKGVLNRQGGLGGNELLTWKTRLCIAKQIANAITYLHTAFPRPIIHRNLSPTSIILDDDFVPKICDFSQSITIPPEQTHVEDIVMGSVGYVDPAYVMTGMISEKSDVYSFGVILLVFLTGRKPFDPTVSLRPENHLVPFLNLHACDESQIQTILDTNITAELGGDDEKAKYQQLCDFLKLALLCVREEGEARPEMIDVAKELVRIDKSVIP